MKVKFVWNKATELHKLILGVMDILVTDVSYSNFH